MPYVLPAFEALFASTGTAAAGGAAAAGTAGATAGGATAVGTGLLPSLTTALATSAIGYGFSKLTQPKMPNINIPPPPGAAMIDPAGQQAAANQRRIAAASGGINSTITGAGSSPAAIGGPTSGAKQLLGN